MTVLKPGSPNYKAAVAALDRSADPDPRVSDTVAKIIADIRKRGDEAVIEFTTLRAPCANLNPYGPGIHGELYDAQCKAGDVTAAHWAHGGFYARVIHAGLISAGVPVILESEFA